MIPALINARLVMPNVLLAIFPPQTAYLVMKLLSLEY